MKKNTVGCRQNHGGKDCPWEYAYDQEKRAWVLTGALNTQEPSCSHCHRVGYHSGLRNKASNFQLMCNLWMVRSNKMWSLQYSTSMGSSLIKERWRQRKAKWISEIAQHLWSIKLQVWNPWEVQGGIVTILLLVSLFVSSCLTMFLLYAFLFLFLHALPYCLYIASCTVHLLMHSPAQFCTVLHSLAQSAY